MHGLGDDEGVEPGASDLQVAQMSGDDAEGAPATVLRCLRHPPHEADIARTVHQLPSVRGQHRAGRVRGLGIGGVGTVAGAAEDTD